MTPADDYPRERIDALLALADRATPEPWGTQNSGGIPTYVSSCEGGIADVRYASNSRRHGANAALIAAIHDFAAALRAVAAERESMSLELAEARRRRDAWKDRAEEYEVLRKALRTKLGDPGPMQLRRAIWAAIAADERTRARDAEAERDALAHDLDRLKARKTALTDEVERLREALLWYAEQAEGCRKIGSWGDPARHALDRDGGAKARAALGAAP